jgi:hypothetical protein
MTNGPYEAPYRFYQNILTQLGHEVRALDNKRSHLQLWRLGLSHRLPGRLQFLYHKIYDSLINAQLRQIVSQWQPDLVLLFKGENIRWQTIQWLKNRTQAVIFNWDHDNPFWPGNTSMHLLYSIPFYDGFGVITKLLAPALYTLACKRVEYLPMFFTPERFQMGEITAADRIEYGCDIAFVGIGAPNRADMLRQLVNFDLAIWGNWDFLDKDDPLRAKVRGFQLDGRDYAKVLKCCKMAVNVLNLQNRYGNNLRTFEATGMGTLLLTEYSQEQAEDLFVEDQEIVCYRSPEELRDKVRYYLAHSDERERIAKAGQARTLAEHTLTHRLKRILDIVEDINSFS